MKAPPLTGRPCLPAARASLWSSVPVPQIRIRSCTGTAVPVPVPEIRIRSGTGRGHSWAWRRSAAGAAGRASEPVVREHGLGARTGGAVGVGDDADSHLRAHLLVRDVLAQDLQRSAERGADPSEDG